LRSVDLLAAYLTLPRPRASGAELFAALMAQDAQLVAAGFPPMTAWWVDRLREFYLSGKRRFVCRVGRKGTKSATMCRVAVNEARHGNHLLRPGDLGLVMFISENTKEAKGRIFTLRAILDALRVPYDPFDGDLRLREKPISFGVRAARIGAVSGPVVICLIDDEVAKWKDEATGANPATEVLRSVRPAMATQVNAHEFMISSPWSTLDAHHEAFSQGDTDDQVVAYAPSWVANPTVAEDFTHTLEPDQATWEREYKAVPMGSTEVSFFDHAVIDLSCTTDLVMPVKAETGAVVTAGGDLAFVRNAAAMAICHRYGAWNDDQSRYLLADELELKPEPGFPLLPGNVIGAFAAKLGQHHVSHLMADGHYRMSAIEHLTAHGLHYADAPEGQQGKADTFVRMRVILHGGRFRYNSPALKKQLKEVTSKPTPGGGLAISSPDRGMGGHGDLLSGVVLALWQQSGYEVLADEPAPGSPEWCRREQFAQKEAAMRAAKKRDRRLPSPY
jgi:hypothetical protein